MSATQPATHAKSAAQPPHQDALQLLMAEHREVKTMFQQYQKLADAGGKGDERMLLASQICVALSVHTQMEEEILYPAARKVLTKDEDIVDEAYVEHAGAKKFCCDRPEQVPCSIHSWRSRSDCVPGSEIFSCASVAADSVTAGSDVQSPFSSSFLLAADTPQYDSLCGHRPCSENVLLSWRLGVSLLHSGLLELVRQNAGSQLMARA